jgi:hypothetical protein
MADNIILIIDNKTSKPWGSQMSWSELPLASKCKDCTKVAWWRGRCCRKCAGPRQAQAASDDDLGHGVGGSGMSAAATRAVVITVPIVVVSVMVMSEFLLTPRQPTAFKNRIIRSLTSRWRKARRSRTSSPSPSISNRAAATEPSFL